MKVIFIDKNKELVLKVKKSLKYFPEKIGVKCDNIFSYEGVIVSASNKDFTLGAGLDALIKKFYPDECSQVEKGKNQRIGSVIFTITVDDELKATRELVGEALSFALKNTKEDETLLISGLGCGIGGLDPDEFVYLFLVALSEHFGYGWGIKYTRKNGYNWSKDGKKKYVIGKNLYEKNAEKNNEECDVGLHLGKSFFGAGNYHIPEKILFCIYDKDNLCGQGDDKVRVNKLFTVCELARWLGYGKNGKNILAKIDKKFNPEDYNPYQAETLPSKEDIKKTELFKVWQEVGQKVWQEVGQKVWQEVRQKVGQKVGQEVRQEVGQEVRQEVGQKVGQKVWQEVRQKVWQELTDQEYAVSYWAINLHFELGIKHWFGDFLKLGVMVVFVDNKVKFFGKKGKYLGEYDREELVVK